MALNRGLLGKQYPPQDYGVTAEATMKYARAYNDDNPWFFDIDRPDGLIAPPLFGVVMSWVSVMAVVTDSELGVDFLRLLHGEQDISFSCPVVPGDIVASTARIAAIDETKTGETLVIEVHCVNQRHEVVQRLLFSFFIRGRQNRERRHERPVAEGTPTSEPLLRVRQTIDADQTYRYAQASGDHNPIHVDENVAKMAGQPGIIIHGLCTMAFTSQVMIAHLCNQDPRRLARLHVRFTRPVFPGQTLTTAVWSRPDRQGCKVYAYETCGPDGKAVIKDGIAEVVS